MVLLLQTPGTVFDGPDSRFAFLYLDCVYVEFSLSESGRLVEHRQAKAP